MWRRAFTRTRTLHNSFKRETNVCYGFPLQSLRILTHRVLQFMHLKRDGRASVRRNVTHDPRIVFFFAMTLG